jgi:Ca-activated chloride channel family protein
VRLILAVAAALALTPAVAHAQGSVTGNRALIVLDASKSMNKDAGNGGTRLDAAKRAVADLVDRLPAGAPIGLRVYGSKVSEVSREEGCRDTELTIPVGPLDKEKLVGTVNALTGKGRTPIGASLLATPDDLGSSEGRRTVVLISDGGDNCAPPDPCDAAREVARQGLDLSISVVGLQVSGRVRRQLQCIADAGGGSYTGVDDADELGDELAALLVRAYRSYVPSGTKVEGAEEAGAGPVLGAGLFQDSLTVGDERWYQLDVPRGRRVLASVTGIPPYESSGGSTYRVELRAPSGEDVGSNQGLLDGGLSATEAGRVLTYSVRTAGPVDGGRYQLGVSLLGGNLDDVPVALELGIQFLAPGEEVGLTRDAGALATPTPTATARPRATAAAGDDSGGGGAGGWLIVAAVGVGGVLVGLAAAAVLGRRIAA